MDTFNTYLEQTNEYGEVSEIRNHIAVVFGLPHAKPNEIVVFESGQLGQVFSIDGEVIEVLILSKEKVRVGAKLTRTDAPLKIPVGEALLGKIISPIGAPLAGVLSYERPKEERDTESTPLGIADRAKINQPLLTGVAIVDVTIPLGKGQRELVLGDRKSGKSSFLLNVIKSQVDSGSVAIYCAVGRRKSDIKRVDEYFRKEGIQDRCIIVSSSYDDPPSLVYMAPYTAMTIAEYFKDKGEDVLVVLDDLSTHAKFYREIALLSKRFPGRDSYPGDIFYTHARLLERAGTFKHAEKGQVSITCLPVAESVENDFGYIVTNLMGMTDGHIFFDSNLYYKGRRPAVNISLSVTRVGKQASSPLRREINHEVTAFLSQYERVQSFSQFGADLSESVKQTIDTGAKILDFFEQDYSVILPVEIQIVLLSFIWLKFFYGKPSSKIFEARKAMLEAYATQEEVRRLFQELSEAKSFNELLGNLSKRQEDILALCKISRE